MNRFGLYVLGAFLGGLIGGGVGLLMAPKAGKQLRIDITEYANHVKSEVRNAAEQRRMELESELEHLREPEKPIA